MSVAPEIAVTLSGALMRHLRSRAAELDVPRRWLVAGLIRDTVDGPTALRCRRPPRTASYIPERVFSSRRLPHR